MWCIIGTGLCDGVASHKMGCALAINASIMAFGLHHLSLRFGHQKNSSQLMAPVLSWLFLVPADGTRAVKRVKIGTIPCSGNGLVIRRCLSPIGMDGRRHKSKCSRLAVVGVGFNG